MTPFPSATQSATTTTGTFPTSTSITPVVIDGVSVFCDASLGWPHAPTCASAIAPALSASGYAPDTVAHAFFGFGTYCAPGSPCPSAPANFAYVVLWPKSGAPPLLVQLSADAAGKVTFVYTQTAPPSRP